ncbi:zinc finger protein ZFP2-like isoform X1 [Mytilus californianus]|uniref:zinc finger protein ZFP2-like isoform X1 n=1 Tax=Mytilus californianus TaxID=6549 RepID=UPI002246D076|nr:zinc finger protein ZFP2-like isoform X1 [Mytilus californianus]
MPKMKKKSVRQKNLEEKLHKRLQRHSKLAFQSKQTTEKGTETIKSDRNKMVSSPDQTNNQPTLVHSNDNSRSGHLQSQIPKSDKRIAASKNKLREYFRKNSGEKPDKSSVVNMMANKSSKTHIGDKPLTCDICCKEFNKMRLLQVHMRTHTGEQPYTCDICCKEFKGKKVFLIHMRTHTGEKPYKCDICCIGFKGKKVFLIHMRTHTGEKPYKCDICSKGFIGETKLQLHMRTHTGEKPYKCDICCKAFGRRTSLTRHRNIHHGHLQSQIPKNDKRIAASKNKVREYLRKNTGKKPDKSGVVNTMANVRNVFDNGQDPTGIKTANEQNICVVNDKSFSQDKQSLLHMRKETSDNLPFTCEICGKGFKGEIRLQVHMRTHTGETPYKCDICFKGFIQRCTLANHMKIHAVHCKICDYANCQCHLQKYSPKGEFAASKNILRKFLIKQTEIKPDKFGVNNTMANVSNLCSNDQEPTRTETENQQFICGVCGEIFNGDKPLVLHMRKHACNKLFTCDICNKRFYQRFNLLVHMRIHTGEKLGTCDICFKKFTEGKSLQIHKSTHSQEKSYKCDVCFKGFFGRNSLTRHMKIHTCDVTNTVANDRNHISNDHDHTISNNDQDHHDHTISNNDQDHHDHTILNTDQDYTISNTDQDHTISNIAQDHTISNTDQDHTISNIDQDHTISNTDQDYTISNIDQDHTISKTDQDHTISNTDQDYTISNIDQDHTISNTD